ncbi:MAG: hypothetical protein MMC33_004754 [Icmadophila ericetorum]|nr:hypothetical protein [Icmadophila ericetorum]
MASFNSLPPELVELVIDYVQPGDILAVARINSLYNTMSLRHVREYHVHREEYGKHCFLLDCYCEDPNRTVLETLCLLLEHPQLSLYCHTLEAANFLIDYRHVENKITDQQSILIRNALQQSPFVLDSEVDSWYEKISLGNGDTMIGLLLPLLPNLRKFAFRISREDQDPAEFLDTPTVLRRIATAESVMGASTPLQYLDEVNLEELLDQDVHIIHSFLAFQSVRRFRLQRCKILSPCIWDENQPRAELQILDIQESKCSEAFLHSFLGPWKKLELFSFSGDRDANGLSAGPEIESRLPQATRTTLRSLDLRQSWDWCHPSPFNRLREFEALESLSISVWTLLGYLSNRVPSYLELCAWSERLPGSLKHLRLQFHKMYLHYVNLTPNDESEKIRAMFDAKAEEELVRFLNAQNGHLSAVNNARLWKLTVENAGVARETRLAAICKKVGVSFEAEPEVCDFWPPPFFHYFPPDENTMYNVTRESYKAAKAKEQHNPSAIDNEEKKQFYIPGGSHGEGRYVFDTEAFILGVGRSVHEDQAGMAEEFTGSSLYFQRWWNPAFESYQPGLAIDPRLMQVDFPAGQHGPREERCR